MSSNIGKIYKLPKNLFTYKALQPIIVLANRQQIIYQKDKLTTRNIQLIKTIDKSIKIAPPNSPTLTHNSWEII